MTSSATCPARGPSDVPGLASKTAAQGHPEGLKQGQDADVLVSARHHTFVRMHHESQQMQQISGGGVGPKAPMKVLKGTLPEHSASARIASM